MKNKALLSLALASAASCMSTEPEVQKTYISDENVWTMCQNIYAQLEQDNFCPDLLIGVARGGLVPLAYLASEKLLNNRNTRTINVQSYSDEKKRATIQITSPFYTQDLQHIKSILVIDDLVDTGNTIHEILLMLKKDLPNATIKVATLFYKPKSIIKPDYFVAETKDWIVFPWEK